MRYIPRIILDISNNNGSNKSVSIAHCWHEDKIIKKDKKKVPYTRKEW